MRNGESAMVKENRKRQCAMGNAQSIQVFETFFASKIQEVTIVWFVRRTVISVGSSRLASRHLTRNHLKLDKVIRQEATVVVLSGYQSCVLNVSRVCLE